MQALNRPTQDAKLEVRRSVCYPVRPPPRIPAIEAILVEVAAVIVDQQDSFWRRILCGGQAEIPLRKRLAAVDLLH